MKPTLCLLVNATAEQQAEYIKVLDKVGEFSIGKNLEHTFDRLKQDEYVITRVPSSIQEVVIDTAKYYGAEVVGIFFKYLPELTRGFDRVILH